MTPDGALAEARSALRSDLRQTGCWSPCTARLLDEALEGRRWWVDQWPDGAEHVPGLVAQDLQEAVQAAVDPDWPVCAEHGDHALFVEPDLGPDPFWVCHRSGLPVAAVGGL